MLRILFPCEKLAHIVDKYYFITGDQHVDHTLCEHIVVPDGTAGLLMILNGTVERKIGKDSDYVELAKISVGGSKTLSSFVKASSPTYRIFGIKFKSNGLREILRIPMHEMINQSISADLIFGSSIETFHQQLGSEFCPYKMSIAADKYLLSHITSTSDKDLIFRAITQYIKSKKGNVKIAHVSNRFEMNYKSMERLFKDHIGYSPKNFASIIQFNSTFYHWYKNPALRLTHLAYQSGYSDQMHFIKNVKKIAGVLPSELYRPSVGEVTNSHREYLAGIER